MYRYVSHFARTLTFVLLVGAAVTQSMAQYVPPQTDVPSSKDSPIVSRFAGSTIVAYQEVNYDEIALPMGPRGDSGFAKTLEIRRKIITTASGLRFSPRGAAVEKLEAASLQ